MITQPAPEPFIGIDEAAAFLGCSKCFLYEHRTHGIPVYKQGLTLKFLRSELDRWQRQRRPKQQARTLKKAESSGFRAIAKDIIKRHKLERMRKEEKPRKQKVSLNPSP